MLTMSKIFTYRIISQWNNLLTRKMYPFLGIKAMYANKLSAGTPSNGFLQTNYFNKNTAVIDGLGQVKSR